MTDKENITIKIKQQGPYETKRIERRTKKGKTEAAMRQVAPGEKKVYEFYISPKGKKYQTIEELGAVERRGVDLKAKKIKKEIKVDKKGKLYKEHIFPSHKTKLIPEKINRNNKRP